MELLRRLDITLGFVILYECFINVHGKSMKTFNGNASHEILQNITNATLHHGNHKGIHIFVNMFDHVSKPFIVCVWILLVSIAKVVFHRFQWLSQTIPESCLLILLGIPVGFIADQVSVDGYLFLTSDLFFTYLLPPIIFDAGYFINSHSFFNNIGTILLYAIIGTIANTFLVGASMYGVSGTADVSISLLHSFLFGALISAVDPVAVLTVFEEVQVNEVLYMLVFGESVLNDAASVVLYRTFENLPEDNIDGEQVGLAIGSFFVVSIFGTLIGVIFGLVASFITRFTEHVPVIEPIFVFIMAWMAYLTAEIFHFSGIMSILFCGVVMAPYVESNISRKSHTTTKYFLKLLASSSEAVIFMFLGVALVQYNHNFNIIFIAWCVLFISIYRVFGIVSLTWLANKFGRLESISRIEQLIMSYGGLRGAVAFCLAIVLKDEDSGELKRLLVTTTLAVIIFTCFIQGATMKKVVEKLKVKKADTREIGVFEHLHEKVLGFTMAGIEEILGVHGHGFWLNLMEVLNRKVLRPCLTRNPEMVMDDALFQQERKIEFSRSTSTDTIQSQKSIEEEESSARTNDATRRKTPTITIMSPSDFAAFLPAAVDNKVKPRRKYTDATVGLHQNDRKELLKGNTKRDGYGNLVDHRDHRGAYPRHHHSHHQEHNRGHHKHHHKHHRHHSGSRAGSHESRRNHGFEGNEEEMPRWMMEMQEQLESVDENEEEDEHAAPQRMKSTSGGQPEVIIEEADDVFLPSDAKELHTETDTVQHNEPLGSPPPPALFGMLPRDDSQPIESSDQSVVRSLSDILDEPLLDDGGKGFVVHINEEPIKDERSLSKVCSEDPATKNTEKLSERPVFDNPALELSVSEPHQTQGSQSSLDSDDGRNEIGVSSSHLEYANPWA